MYATPATFRPAKPLRSRKVKPTIPSYERRERKRSKRGRPMPHESRFRLRRALESGKDFRLAWQLPQAAGASRALPLNFSGVLVDRDHPRVARAVLTALPTKISRGVRVLGALRGRSVRVRRSFARTQWPALPSLVSPLVEKAVCCARGAASIAAGGRAALPFAPRARRAQDALLPLGARRAGYAFAQTGCCALRSDPRR